MNNHPLLFVSQIGRLIPIQHPRSFFFGGGIPKKSQQRRPHHCLLANKCLYCTAQYVRDSIIFILIMQFEIKVHKTHPVQVQYVDHLGYSQIWILTEDVFYDNDLECYIMLHITVCIWPPLSLLE